MNNLLNIYIIHSFTFIILIKIYTSLNRDLVMLREVDVRVFDS